MSLYYWVLAISVTHGVFSPAVKWVVQCDAPEADRFPVIFGHYCEWRSADWPHCHGCVTSRGTRRPWAQERFHAAGVSFNIPVTPRDVALPTANGMRVLVGQRRAM
jgi:hypothetical protein